MLDCADEDDEEGLEDWATLSEHTPSEPEKVRRGGHPFQIDSGSRRTSISCATARILWNLTVSSFVAFPSWQSLFRRGTGPDCAVVLALWFRFHIPSTSGRVECHHVGLRLLFGPPPEIRMCTS